MRLAKGIFLICAFLALQFSLNWFYQTNQITKTELSLKQMTDHRVVEEINKEKITTESLALVGYIVIGLLGFFLFWDDIKKALKFTTVLSLLFLTGCGGCGRKPFEPIKLEVIGTNEEAFLIPLTGDGTKQTKSNNEEYLKANLVYTKQIQIPQQWVAIGYENWSWNGKWHDAATLVKVDTSPVTREWTADTTSGTSTKNEAIWVMTSDQVEFSTGWTCTARISNRDDAVKFLHNYANGSMIKVLDEEVRSKIQAEFGLEVTDLPMDTLRKQATPHIVKVVTKVTAFFQERGITITNLGITGGFIYKDKSILDTMVKVFNAEQEKAIATAAYQAQMERNKAVISKAQGEADAIIKTKEAEAKGIQMLADAKVYEIEAIKKDPDGYFKLKQIELQRELLMKWDGRYPQYFMGAGNAGPNMLLQLPNFEKK